MAGHSYTCLPALNFTVELNQEQMEKTREKLKVEFQ